jgi:hypothetical protein
MYSRLAARFIGPILPSPKLYKHSVISINSFQGPLAMALAFLSDFHHDNENDREKVLNISRDHHKLRLCFKAFVKW